MGPIGDHSTSRSHLNRFGMATLALLTFAAGCLGAPEPDSVSAPPTESVEHVTEALKVGQIFTFEFDKPALLPKSICGLLDGEVTLVSPDCTLTVKTTCTFNETTKKCDCTSTITGHSGSGC